MIKLLLPFIVTVGLAAPATAAITTSQNFTGSLGAAFLPPAGFSTTLEFNPFNNPGEVLTSVKLSYSSGFQSDFIAVNVNLFGSPSSRQITIARGISAGISDNGFNLADTNIVSKTLTVPRPATTSFGNSISGTPNLGLTTAIPNLLSATSFYDVTLTYESEAIPPIPEPASWAMMIAGFDLAGAALRRRRAAIA
jgi:hypothetical protein